MDNLPRSGATLLVRTDFSDEAAWQTLRTVVTTPDDEDEAFLAVLRIVDDPAYRDLTAQQIAALAPAEDDLLIVADKKALTDPQMPLLALYMDDEGGDEDGDESEQGPAYDELRVVAKELWAIENNISAANMDWEEFVAAAEEDGVFRGF
ncbi:hypothetical protein GCM10010129_78360 [Streptomyces fumigatiscleroticus]|nr:hypothetical protein GCM10010129_78360 [Streptomyces fumigatiscleroticus]